MSERFAEAARGVLCTAECTSSHLNRLEQDAREQGKNLRVAQCGRRRQEEIRGIVVGCAVDRLKRGEVGMSWREFTYNASNDALPLVEAALPAIVVWLFWKVVVWIVFRVMEYIVESILAQVFAPRMYSSDGAPDVAAWVDNDPAAMIQAWEGMPCDGQ